MMGQPQAFSHPPIQATMVLYPEDLIRLLGCMYQHQDIPLPLTLEVKQLPDGRWFVSSGSLWREIERLGGGVVESFRIAGLNPDKTKELQ
jgi:hypothetical protein